MKTNSQAPCEWPLLSFKDENGNDEDCFECSAFTSLSTPRQASIQKMAIELLWNWTGRKYGLCEETVRPCRIECTSGDSTFWGSSNRPGYIGGWHPVLLDGKWYNLGCGICGSNSCNCGTDLALALELPGPVDSIEEIYIHGELLDEEDYELRDGVLYRVDGGYWPACNNSIDDPTEEGSTSWSVKYKRGIPVPEAGKLAATTLACELAKSMCGDNTCRLPRRLQSITRQGVTVAVLDGFENLEEGFTGIWEIDSWISSTRYGIGSLPQVFSPDIPAGYMRGSAAGLGHGRTQ